MYFDIEKVKKKSLLFADLLNNVNGYKYTINHDITKYPSAILYGTWSVAYLYKLLLGDSWKDEGEKAFILRTLNRYRRSDGLFFPPELDATHYPKSKEYMLLHCYNYSVGAAIEINPDFDFHSSYMDAFLDPDFLERWLNQRSLERPWEESNNIVNVASYLALSNDNGIVKGKDRLYQMLEWHNRVQNPKTGGFEIFNQSRKNTLQSMAGAVHNFHIHHYLNEPMNYEKQIAQNVIPYLFEGPLTACLSIDFVELACRTIKFLDDPYELEQALLFHLNALIEYQNADGGWYENESYDRPTTANGMKEDIASSNSYGTWFRLCSIGMILITLFDEDPDRWHFRKTLGMGYAPPRWDKLSPQKIEIDTKVLYKYKKKNLPHVLKQKAIEIAVKFLR